MSQSWKLWDVAGGAGKAVLVAPDESTEEGTEHSSPQPCRACGAVLDPGHAFCPKCGEESRQHAKGLPSRACAPSCWGKCCLAGAVLTVVFVVGLSLYLNSLVRFGVETVGSAVLGVDVSLEAVNVGIPQARATLTNLAVASPEGFSRKFIELGRFVFDLSPLSLLSAWLSSFARPIVLEEVRLQDTAVSIDMRSMTAGESNAQKIVDHMNRVTAKVAPEVHEQIFNPKLPDAKTAVHEGIKAMEVKIQVGKVVLQNISASVIIEPLAPVSYTLSTILITDVGKKEGGVYLYEFIEILVRALLMSVLKSAPDNVQANMAKAFGTDLWKTMDFAMVRFDSGRGLEEVGEFAGWASTQAALLPIKMAAQGAKVTADAIGVGAKLNQEALEVGARMTGMATKGQLAATNAQVELGTKAAATAAKMGLAFSNGVTQALTR